MKPLCKTESKMSKQTVHTLDAWKKCLVYLSGTCAVGVDSPHTYVFELNTDVCTESAQTLTDLGGDKIYVMKP